MKVSLADYLTQIYSLAKAQHYKNKASHLAMHAWLTQHSKFHEDTFLDKVAKPS